MSDPQGVPDEALLQQALEGLFAIAHEDRPAETRQALHDQVASLSPDQREQLLGELVDRDRFRVYLDKASRDDEIPATIPRLEEGRMQKIDAVLDPLARLQAGSEGARSIQTLRPDQRAQILFDTLSGPQA